MKRFLIQIHKITGSVLSLLFLIWCLSGIVLLYKGFPHASSQNRFEALEYLNESDFSNLPLFTETNTGKTELEKYQGNLIYRKYTGRKSQQIFDAQTFEEIAEFSKAEAIKEAEHFVNAKVLSIDCINELDSWLPWGHYKPLLPFYKCYLDDENHSAVYVSAKTGTVIQHTTRYSRWMARLGAIPHIIYFYQIKQHAIVWKNTVLVLGLIGILASISGMIVAFFRFCRNKAGKITGISVYKKWSYKWHHVIGLFIGIFFFTFLLSGIFYATGVPSWISAKAEGRSPQSIWNKRIETNTTMPPGRIWQLLPKKAGLRKIGWTSSMGKPVLEAFYNNYKTPENFIISNDTLIPFKATKEEIAAYAIKTLKNQNISIEAQTEYDNYYKSSGMYYHSLPAYKINLNDAFNTSIYIAPESGKAVEQFNNNKRTNRWLTRGLHKLHFSIFNKVEWLRKATLIILCLGGLAVSFTGVILSWKWLRRGLKRLNKKK